MSLKKCRALIRHLFLSRRVRNARCCSLRGQDESSSRRVGLLFAALFRHRGRLLCILPKKEPQPWLRLYSSSSGTSERGSTLVEKTI